jgi:hypothetical protein
MKTPVTPKEVIAARIELVPTEVITVFNELIIRHWNSYSSTIIVKEVYNMLKEKYNVTEWQVDWLPSIKEVYSLYGWIVEYQQESTYDAFFVFKKKD